MAMATESSKEIGERRRFDNTKHRYKIKTIDGRTIAEWESEAYTNPQSFKMDKKYKVSYYIFRVME